MNLKQIMAKSSTDGGVYGTFAKLFGTLYHSRRFYAGDFGRSRPIPRHKNQRQLRKALRQ